MAKAEIVLVGKHGNVFAGAQQPKVNLIQGAGRSDDAGRTAALGMASLGAAVLNGTG